MPSLRFLGNRGAEKCSSEPPMHREQLLRGDPLLLQPEFVSPFQPPVHARDRLRVHSRGPHGVIQVLHRPVNRLLFSVLSRLFPGYEVPMFVWHNV